MDRKVCPLTFASSDIDFFCEREKCQWWNKDECSMQTIAKCLEEIVISLQLIAKGYVDDGR